MESISNILKKSKPPTFEREMKEDEYLHDGMFFCKSCKTPRQTLIDFEDGRGERLFPQHCECQRIEYERQEEEENRRKHDEAIFRLRCRAIPNPAYRQCTFAADDNKTPRTTQICKEYVAKFDKFSAFGGGLIFWGSVGTGKTFFAMCIANALVDSGLNVYCTSLSEVVKMAQDFDNADRHFSMLMSKKMIVVDDLGAERGTEFATEKIYEFIDGCNTHSVPLIFTTNYSPDILQKACEDTTDLTYARIYSRILEKCTPIAVLDIKRRKNNAEANYSLAAELLGLK